jgi:hypothetical protein
VVVVVVVDGERVFFCVGGSNETFAVAAIAAIAAVVAAVAAVVVAVARRSYCLCPLHTQHNQAGEVNEGTMATVIGVEDAELKRLCEDVSRSSGQVVAITNYLFPKGRVVAGNPKAVALLHNAIAGRSVSLFSLGACQLPHCKCRLSRTLLQLHASPSPSVSATNGMVYAVQQQE